MGLAASQARLLSITARMHDVEFEAQNIMNKKLALSTQKDELYSEYCAALDAKKIQIAFTNGEGGKLNYVDATFATVCGFNSDRKGNYAMTDANTGKMLVENDVYEAYKNFQGGDKYAFALQMLGFDEEDTSKLLLPLIGLPTGYAGFSEANKDSAVPDPGNEYSGSFKDSSSGTYTGYLLMTAEEGAVYEKHKDDTGSNNLVSLMAKFEQAKTKGDKSDVEKAINSFRSELYTKYAGEIYSGVCTTLNTEALGEFDAEMASEFQYYAQLFEGIEAMGGCLPISDFAQDGDTGNTWFNNVINTGRVILNEYLTTGTQKGWKEISVATSTNVQEVSDETDLKKAEAEYEHELSKINKKDTKYDQDLNKLETERSALKTELDSIKQVKNDNIERTFGIFS